jgi:hypothetical protein
MMNMRPPQQGHAVVRVMRATVYALAKASP